MLTIYFNDNSSVSTHCNVNEVDNYLDYVDSTLYVNNSKVIGFTFEQL